MPDPGRPTLDQLRVLLAVVDAGGFAAAGRRLGRATSAVSYTIGQLERQIGVMLFDRAATRRPVLTAAGSAILAKARVVAVGMDDLRASAKALLEGLEAEVALVVDVMLPPARLVDAVQAFEAQFPSVNLRLQVEALGGVPQSVRAGFAGLGLGGGLRATEPDLELIHVGEVEMIPVAAAGHPLARSAIQPGEARRHRQLVLTVRSPFTEGEDVGVFGADAWRMADLGAKHALLLAGVGWGHMPAPLVAADLAAGRLVRLDLPEARSGAYPFHALYRTDSPPGPAAAWLVERFAHQANWAEASQALRGIGAAAPRPAGSVGDKVS